MIVFIILFHVVLTKVCPPNVNETCSTCNSHGSCEIPCFNGFTPLYSESLGGFECQPCEEAFEMCLNCSVNFDSCLECDVNSYPIELVGSGRLIGRACGNCSEKFNNCKKCSRDACLECTQNFTLNELYGFCFDDTSTNPECSTEFCSSCPKSPLFCASCAEGYFLENGDCLECVDGCKTCESYKNIDISVFYPGGKCMKCRKGYILREMHTQSKNTLYSRVCEKFDISKNLPDLESSDRTIILSLLVFDSVTCSGKPIKQIELNSWNWLRLKFEFSSYHEGRFMPNVHDRKGANGFVVDKLCASDISTSRFGKGVCYDYHNLSLDAGFESLLRWKILDNETTGIHLEFNNSQVYSTGDRLFSQNDNFFIEFSSILLESTFREDCIPVSDENSNHIFSFRLEYQNIVMWDISKLPNFIAFPIISVLVCFLVELLLVLFIPTSNGIFLWINVVHYCYEKRDWDCCDMSNVIRMIERSKFFKAISHEHYLEAVNSTSHRLKRSTFKKYCDRCCFMGGWNCLLFYSNFVANVFAHGVISFILIIIWQISGFLMTIPLFVIILLSGMCCASRSICCKFCCRKELALVYYSSRVFWIWTFEIGMRILGLVTASSLAVTFVVVVGCILTCMAAYLLYLVARYLVKDHKALLREGTEFQESIAHIKSLCIDETRMFCWEFNFIDSFDTKTYLDDCPNESVFTFILKNGEFRILKCLLSVNCDLRYKSSQEVKFEIHSTGEENVFGELEKVVFKFLLLSKFRPSINNHRGSWKYMIPLFVCFHSIGSEYLKEVVISQLRQLPFNRILIIYDFLVENESRLPNDCYRELRAALFKLLYYNSNVEAKNAFQGLFRAPHSDIIFDPPVNDLNRFITYVSVGNLFNFFEDYVLVFGKSVQPGDSSNDLDIEDEIDVLKDIYESNCVVRPLCVLLRTGETFTVDKDIVGIFSEFWKTMDHFNSLQIQRERVEDVEEQGLLSIEMNSENSVGIEGFEDNETIAYFGLMFKKEFPNEFGMKEVLTLLRHSVMYFDKYLIEPILKRAKYMLFESYENMYPKWKCKTSFVRFVENEVTRILNDSLPEECMGRLLEEKFPEVEIRIGEPEEGVLPRRNNTDASRQRVEDEFGKLYKKMYGVTK